MDTDLLNSLGGTATAFVLAICVVGTDIQEAVKAQLGALANTFVLAIWQGWLIVIGWGLAAAAVFQFIIHHPAWASSTFHFDISGNAIMAGFAVGISAVVVIRSKLAKIGSIELGGEWAYLWSRAYVLNAVNQVRVKTRIHGEKLYDPIAQDLPKYPHLFSDLETWLRESLKGKAASMASSIEAQIAEIKKQANPAPDQDVNARRYLIGVALDYIPPGEFNHFAEAVGLPVRS